MEVYRVMFDAILTIMKHPVTIAGYTFSYFGLFIVSTGAWLVSVVLRAIFSDD